jgi:cytochrome c|tara:strand:+ start:79 stop:513 length:435 start_codon:yes stop_codon:yes gene_type:complete
MIKYKTILFAGILTSIFFSLNSAKAFHKDVYYPRAPEALLEILQDMDNPFPPTKKNIKEGNKVYFGKGLCVKCHGEKGKGVKVPGHSPRNFTDAKWQDVRTDGEMMWVLKNGSPGTSMPIRVGKVISEKEGWKVILFIRSLAGV